MTMETASFRILSPKMTEYNLGSTLSWLKIARIVTGSVADKTDPKIIESKKLSCNDSNPVSDSKYTRILFEGFVGKGRKGTEVLVVLVSNFVGMTNWSWVFVSFLRLGTALPERTQGIAHKQRRLKIETKYGLPTTTSQTK